jgi:DNA-binding NarL/FixJ family response regulator
MDGGRATDIGVRIRVLIVAQYAAVRAGLHALIAEDDGIEVVGAVSTAAELTDALNGSQPDVVLYDRNEADARLVLDLTSGSESALVVLGENPEGAKELADQPIRGWAYLLKEAGAAEIAGAIRAAAAGLIALDRSLVPLFHLPEAPTLARESAGYVEDVLTVREMDVLQLMAQGLPNKTIAARLTISQNTAKFHVASILGKLGASSRTEAVTLGARRGLVRL